MTRYVGIDLHKRIAQICILGSEGTLLKEFEIPVNRDSLKQLAVAQLTPEDHVVFEATTNTWAVCELLEPYVASVTVSNPLQTKAIANAKVKTDKVDARVLAELLRCDFLPTVWQPDPLTRRMRQLTNRRASLVSDQTGFKNRIHAILAHRLIEVSGDLFSTQGRAWLTTLHLDEDGRFALEADLRLLEAVAAEIEALDKKIAQITYEQEDVKLLMTLPGVSMVVAMGLVAAWGDIQRFPSADKAASYLGLAPSTRQSAAKCYHGPITKQGAARARWLLVQAAQHMMRSAGPHGFFGKKLRKRKNHNIALVATARKMATIAWHMLRNREPYRYAAPRSTETKLAKLRFMATGKRRRGGIPKGAKQPEAYGSGVGTRAIPSVGGACAKEGLPQPKKPNEISAGERRVLQRTDSKGHFEMVSEPRRVPRKAAAQP